MIWEVELIGDEDALGFLSQELQSAPITVARIGAGHYCVGPAIQCCGTADEARAKVKELVPILNGICQFARQYSSVLRVGSVQRLRADGKRDHWMYIEESFEIQAILGQPTLVVNGAPGSAPHRPSESLLRIALADDAVRKALRLFSDAEKSWVELYRLYEVVEGDAGGLDAIVGNGWSSKTKLKLFKHTANSPRATGDASRHGSSSVAPPPNPMSLGEARSFVDELLRQWFRSKGATGI